MDSVPASGAEGESSSLSRDTVTYAYRSALFRLHSLSHPRLRNPFYRDLKIIEVFLARFYRNAHKAFFNLDTRLPVVILLFIHIFNNSMILIITA